jgi:hypothetical protein
MSAKQKSKQKKGPRRETAPPKEAGAIEARERDTGSAERVERSMRPAAPRAPTTTIALMILVTLLATAGAVYLLRR